MPLFGLLLFAISAVLLGSAPASADERGFLALFEGQPESTAATPEQERLAKAPHSPGLSNYCGVAVLIGMSSCGQLTTRLLVKLNASWIGIQTPIINHPRLCCLRP